MSQTLPNTRRYTAVGASLPTTVHMPGYGDISRLGPRLADWEPVMRDGDYERNLDSYEIAKFLRRIGR